MNFAIIIPTEKHIEQMVTLANEARQYHIDLLNGYFKPEASSFEREVIKQHIKESETHIIFIAVDEQDNVLGMILGEIQNKPWLENSHIGYASNFIVNSKFRRQGIGKKLMDAFVNECKNRKIQEITLGVYNKNKNSYNFYVEYGFEPITQKMSLKI